MERLETLDFDVVDSKYIWLTFLDSREIEYNTPVFRREEYEWYKRFYTHLLEEAKQFPILKNVSQSEICWPSDRG
ncbi:hypothetical protein AMJ40_06735 [candidate division TA06 bacterium DG_26]|uniref:Uncharacterized protein n=1 Tax=candidate division TA06 bacterium DG_26 TaxID=1703771 RepID=A0A0S7WFC5_UNCT6|nr:MAG: hypothetical protein AMJ40_06735 [candidate division TA06 bacterium DG_26]